MQPLQSWVESAPPGKVKASENLGVTAVAPVAHAVTSLVRTWCRKIEKSSIFRPKIQGLDLRVVRIPEWVMMVLLWPLPLLVI